MVKNIVLVHGRSPAACAVGETVGGTVITRWAMIHTRRIVGLPMSDRKLMFVVQGQSYAPTFDEKLTTATWKTKPTWAIVSANDRMLPSAMEESGAKRIGRDHHLT